MRRLLLGIAAISVVGCASGPPTRLHTLGTPSGNGEIRFEVENRSSAVVNSLFVVRSEKVQKAGREAMQPGSPEEAQLWGDDLLTRSGLEHEGRIRVPISEPGRYDVRVVDRDGREQHLSGLRLQPGGRYRLEIEDATWRGVK